MASTATGQGGAPALYMHRDGTMDDVAPTSADDAVFTFGLLPPHNVTFATAPLTEPFLLRGPLMVRVTLGAVELSVQGQLSARLLAGGTPVAKSTTQDVLVDLRPRDYVLTFNDVNATVPAGQSLGLDIGLIPFLDVGGASVLDLKVDLLYDSTAHPSGAQLLGNQLAGLNGTVGKDGRPGAPGLSRGPSGPATDTTGNGDQPLNRTGGIIPPIRLGLGDMDPFIVMMGVGTSAIALVVSLALRGRVRP